jgi:very-short-patch-repair endonuclease
MRTSDRTIDAARRLRRTMTLPEVVLWQRVRGGGLNGHLIRRQQPYGPFVLDFYCRAAKLAIEVDGWVHGRERQARHDDERDAWLRSQGVEVHRIPAAAILGHLPDALAGLADVLDRRARPARRRVKSEQR